MIGQNLIIQLRKAGHEPQRIIVADHDGYADISRSPKFTDDVVAPKVTIEAADNIDLLDLRFCIGLTVFVEGCRASERTRLLANAVRNSGAYLTIAFHAEGRKIAWSGIRKNAIKEVA